MTDPDAEVKALLMETKRCILYVIRVQSGGDLMEIMVKPITMEDEDRWEALVREELSAGTHRRGAYAESGTITDIASMSYAELKRTALENILHLEQYGRLTRHNHTKISSTRLPLIYAQNIADVFSVTKNSRLSILPSPASETKPHILNSNSKPTMTTSSKPW